MTALARLERQRVVPVLRSADVEDALATARAAAAGGLTVVELTMTTPGVLEAVGPLVDEGLVVGVGTIKEPDEVRAVAGAGAGFAVSFWNPPGFVAAASAAGITAVPGGLTPAELAAADRAGARAVKLFPAMLVSPRYLRALAPVLPSLRVFVTGGIGPSEEAIRPWLDAGALAVGVGSALGTARSVGVDVVERRCRALSQAFADKTH